MTNIMESPANMRFGALSMSQREEMKPLQMIAVQDIGKWVAHMFLNRERFLGKAVEIAGDEVDFNKMMSAYKNVYGKTPLDMQPPTLFTNGAFNFSFG